MLVGLPLDNQTSATMSADENDKLCHWLNVVANDRCRQSFTRLFNHFAPRLRSYALKQFGNEAQAMELVQDTMTNVWQKAYLFNADKGAASTWIFTIARNIRFDMLRKQQSRKEDICSEDLWPVLFEQTADPKALSMEHNITLEQVEQYFESLPQKQKDVLEAIYFEGKSQQEVADELGVPLGTVKSRTRLGLQRLKEMLNEQD